MISFHRVCFSTLLLFSIIAYAQVSWSPESFYQKGAVVNSNGVLYVSIARNLNKPPASSPNHWILKSTFIANRESINTNQNIFKQPEPINFGYSLPMNNGIIQNLNSSQSSAQLETWSSTKIYTKGRIVVFDGINWRANYWSQGDTPGLTDVWSPTTTTNWSKYIAYTKGMSAIYNGVTYTAQWWTKGDVPLNDQTGVWLNSKGLSADSNITNRAMQKSADYQTASISTAQPTVNNYEFLTNFNTLNPSSYPEWRADLQYSQGATVSYDGAVWRKMGVLDTRKSPALDGQWLPLTVTKWYPTVNYIKGVVVKFGDVLWYSQWANINIDPPPKDSTGVWVQVDINGNRVYTSERSDYMPNHVYVRGDKCMYEGISWFATYWNQYEKPGTTQAWVPLALTKWYPSVAYDPRESESYRYRVIYKGIQWQAAYWTKGDEPSKSDVWKPLGLTDWVSKVAYVENDQVIFDGTTWRAAYWTQGESPSSSNVWIALTTPSWYAGRSYNAGDMVKYNGSIWIAQYGLDKTANSSNPPGSTSVWVRK